MTREEEKGMRTGPTARQGKDEREVSSPVAGGGEGRKGEALARHTERVDRGGIEAGEDGRGERRDRGEGQRTQLLLDNDVATRSLDGQHRGGCSCAGGWWCQMGLGGVTDPEDVMTVFTEALVGAGRDVVEGYRRFLLYFRFYFACGARAVLVCCFLLSAFCGFSEGVGQQGRWRGKKGDRGRTLCWLVPCGIRRRKCLLKNGCVTGFFFCAVLAAVKKGGNFSW